MNECEYCTEMEQNREEQNYAHVTTHVWAEQIARDSPCLRNIAEFWGPGVGMTGNFLYDMEMD